MLAWANRSGIFCFLDNHDYSIQPHRHDCLLAAGVKAFVEPGSITDIDDFIKHYKGWIFGHLSYDLKNEIHEQQETRPNKVGFPHFFFFQPSSLLRLTGNELCIEAENADQLFSEIQGIRIISSNQPAVLLQQKLTKDSYIDKIKSL